MTSTGTAFPSTTMKTSSQDRSTSSQVLHIPIAALTSKAVYPSFLTLLCFFFLFNVPAGMLEMLRKINMSRAVRTMQELFPEEYDFYPRSWILPEEYQLFATQVCSQLKVNQISHISEMISLHIYSFIFI